MVKKVDASEYAEKGCLVDSNGKPYYIKDILLIIKKLG